MEVIGLTASPAVSAAEPLPEERAAEDVAALIIHDMFEIGSLEAQRARLGNALKAPLPLSSLDAASPARPVLATELLAYEGSFDTFSRALHNSAEGHEQLHRAIAVTQASGSGKTKLAYAEGLRSSLVILVRVVTQNTGFTRPWSEYMELAKKLEVARAGATPAQKRSMSETALAAMRLLVSSYAEWATLVLSAFLSARSKLDATAADMSNPEARAAAQEVALRCLRNVRGERAVASLFKRRLEKMAENMEKEPSTTQEAVVKLSDAVVKEHTSKIAARLSALLWEGATVVVWYDEAQALLSGGGVSRSNRTPQVFLRLSDYLEHNDDDDDVEPKDVFYGLTALMRSLLDPPLSWRQVICGPWLELSEQVELPRFSCVHDRVSSLHHASFIGEEEMIRSLSRYFVIDAPLSESTMELLRQLSGRPVWFFDTFWQQLWNHVGGTSAVWGTSSTAVTTESTGVLLPAAPATSAAVPSLSDHIEMAARAAIELNRQSANRIVKRSWEDATERGDGDRHSMFSLCRELYAALKMNGGVVDITQPSATNDAIRFGLLALEPAKKGGAVSALLSKEPCIAAALEAIGDDLVVRSRNKPDDDPIYQVLSASKTMGQIASFHLTTSVKGPVLELFVVWSALRAGIIAGGRPVSLFSILAPYFSSGCISMPMGKLLDGWCMTATRARNLNELKKEDHTAVCSNWPFGLNAATDDVILHGIDGDAGADVVFAVTDSKSGARRLVLVQAKAQEKASLAECLRSATPAWQYTRTQHRRQLLTDEKAEEGLTTKRKEFQALIGDTGSKLVFDEAIRVAFCVNDFSRDSVAMCRFLNERPPCAGSPLVLCSLQNGAVDPRCNEKVPKLLVDALIDCCKEDGVSHPVSDPTADHDKALWVPFPVSMVTRALDPSTAEEARKEMKALIAQAFAPLDREQMVDG
jgi:hypothetical protein